MIRRGQSSQPAANDCGFDMPWVGCSESHANPNPWNLLLCEDLGDLPVIAHCSACGALLGTDCCVGDGENGSDWQGAN